MNVVDKGWDNIYLKSSKATRLEKIRLRRRFPIATLYTFYVCMLIYEKHNEHITSNLLENYD